MALLDRARPARSRGARGRARSGREESCADSLLAAVADERMPGRLADLLEDLPAARALVAGRQQRLDRHARDFRQGEGARGALAFGQLAARGDGDLGEVEAVQG